MENLDTKILVHVGVELVIIGGLTFWFQRKTSLQQEEINNLRDELSKAKEVINHQGKILAQHEQILEQLMGKRGPSGFSGENRRPPNTSPSQGHSGLHPTTSHRSHQPANFQQLPVEEEEENISDDELDNLLDEELGDIHKSRKQTQSPDSEFIELDCSNGVCDLKNMKGSTKSENKTSVKKKGQKKKRKREK